MFRVSDGAELHVFCLGCISQVWNWRLFYMPWLTIPKSRKALDYCPLGFRGLEV